MSNLLQNRQTAVPAFSGENPQEATDYEQSFSELLEGLREEGRYRVFLDIGRQVGGNPRAHVRGIEGVKHVDVWCSNDYLGMSHHPSVIQAVEDALHTYGAGAGGTRNISGTHHLLVDLEEELAELHEKQGALLFTSGFVANDTALSTLGAVLKDSIILSDANNHASMIAGIRNSRTERAIFRHSDPEHLGHLLQQISPSRPKIVAFESIYSMEGDIAPLAELIEVCKRFGAFIYIDETHAVGVYGKRGGGIVADQGLLAEVDMIQGGLGKGYGVVGGFVTGSAKAIDVVRSYGGGFIFTTSLPPVVCAGALASVRHLKQSQVERETLFERVKQLKNELRAADIPILHTPGHMVPVMVANSFRCKEIADCLLKKYQVYVQPINYPTVPKGEERLRVTPTAAHSAETVSEFVEKLRRAWSECHLPNAGLQ